MGTGVGMFGNLGKEAAICYGATVIPAYVVGPLAIAISLIVALVQGILAGVTSLKRKYDMQNGDVQEMRDAAKYSLKCAAFFTIGLIPLVGGYLGYQACFAE